MLPGHLLEERPKCLLGLQLASMPVHPHPCLPRQILRHYRLSRSISLPQRPNIGHLVLHGHVRIQRLHLLHALAVLLHPRIMIPTSSSCSIQAPPPPALPLPCASTSLLLCCVLSFSRSLSFGVCMHPHASIQAVNCTGMQLASRRWHRVNIRVGRVRLDAGGEHIQVLRK